MFTSQLAPRVVFQWISMALTFGRSAVQVVNWMAIIPLVTIKPKRLVHR
jgi:hypothetical protein